jgi:hypothetical protein
MPVRDIDIAEADGNYKGLLIQYCQERGLSQPRFTETQLGTADAPSWKVTVHYGDRVHETTDPIPGAKKGAHQFAAKQVLDTISENRERLLMGEVDTEDDIMPEPVETQVFDEPLEVALPLITSAMAIANERLGTSQPSRYRGVSDAEFSRKLAQLTMQVVRDLAKAADEANIKFPDVDV